MKSIVTVMAKSGVPDNDYAKKQFHRKTPTPAGSIASTPRADCWRRSRFIWFAQSGEVKIFDLSQIDYNQPIDPNTWKLELPADVSWAQLEPPKLPDNEKYASMTPEQAARAFFEACSREDWNEVGKFMSPVNPT